MTDNTMLFTAVYNDKATALSDLRVVEQLHKDKMIGKYDAAVIDKENGTPHVVRRADHPGIRVIPEVFGGGALPRKELHEAAQELTSGDVGLVVVGDMTLDKGLDEALKSAVSVVKRDFDADADELSRELSEALKS